MRSRLLVATIAALFALPVCAQQMYRWVDKDGKVNYSDKPPQPGSAKVEQRRMTGSVVESGGATDFAVQQAAKNFPVTMYSAPTCQAPCVEARGVLSKRGVPFVEVVVTDEATREQLKKVSGDTQVPVLVVGRDVTKGYEIGMWNAALDSAGYPKSVAPNRMTSASAPPAPKPAPAKPEESGEASLRTPGPYTPK
jgi:glutaredoxin